MTDDTPAVPAPASPSLEDHAKPDFGRRADYVLECTGPRRREALIEELDAMWLDGHAACILSRDSGKVVKDVPDNEVASAIGYAITSDGKRLGDTHDLITRMNIILEITEANPWRIVRAAAVLPLSASAARLNEEADKWYGVWVASRNDNARLTEALETEQKYHDDCWEGCLEEARQANAEGENEREALYMQMSAAHHKRAEFCRLILEDIPPRPARRSSARVVMVKSM